jgi:hypothetical protein
MATFGRADDPVRVNIRGPLFDKRIDRVVQQQIIREAMPKFEKRLRRRGRRIGRRNNPIRPGELTLGRGATMVMTSTLHHPRTTGSSWQGKNIAIVKAMAPRVLRSLARKLVGELGG